MSDLGILDIRSIIGCLEKLYTFDFKNLALTSFKRQLERVIDDNMLRNADELIRKLETDKTFLDNFLFGITIKGTELFRDPSVWRFVQSKMVEKISNSTSEFKIWFSGNCLGEELYSFLILLKQAGLNRKVKIYVSVLSDKGIDSIKAKILDIQQYELSFANYERILTTKPLLDYFTSENDRMLDPDLLTNVEFIKENSIFDNSPTDVDLVFLRNQMIYFNQILQDKFLKAVYNSLKVGGELIIGSSESLENTLVVNDFIRDSSGENIFKKKK